MIDDKVFKSVSVPASAAGGGEGEHGDSSARSFSKAHSESRKYDTLFNYAWLTVNGLLVVSILLALYAVGWEFSTRRYLKGFSDAIVPATAPGDEKIEAILSWMQNGPTRLPYGPSPLTAERDPTDTLNYNALLQVCGTATNAFINLASTSNLEVRRLLLLDQNQMTKHVVAEVRVNGKWIIVDPAFRVVFRDPNGRTVTREDMSNPATFAAVIKNIPKFSADYTFENTVHVRIARFHVLGMPLRAIFNRLAPGWEDSMTMTLLVERESYAATVASILLVLFLVLLRFALRWFGEARLGIRAIRLRSKIYRARLAFLDPAN